MVCDSIVFYHMIACQYFLNILEKSPNKKGFRMKLTLHESDTYNESVQGMTHSDFLQGLNSITPFI